MECNIGEIPERSRLERYLKEFSLVEKEEKDIDDFIKLVFRESMTFLKQKLTAEFPTILLTKCYNSRDFDKLWNASGKKPKSGKRPVAFIKHSPPLSVPARIVIDLETLLTWNAKSFVLNFVLTIFEELLHSAYPLNTEMQTRKLLCPLAEEFLSIKLPEEYKTLNIDE
jgi:hypothetical protein